MDDPPPPPVPDDEEDVAPPPQPDDDDDNIAPPPAPSDDAADGSPPASPMSPQKIAVDRSQPVHAESDFRILIREMKKLVGAPDDDESANPPEPLKTCTWEAVYSDSYIDSYFGERLSSVLQAARKQKVVTFAPERLVKGVKKDAQVTLLTYQVPEGLKGAGAYQKQVAKAEERAAANAKKADEMKQKLKDMKTTVGQLIEEEEIVEEEEEDEAGGSDDDVPPPPPPPDSDDGDDPPPPPPPDSDDGDDPPPPPPPDSDDGDDPPPPPPE